MKWNFTDIENSQYIYISKGMTDEILENLET